MNIFEIFHSEQYARLMRFSYVHLTYAVYEILKAEFSSNKTSVGILQNCHVCTVSAKSRTKKIEA